MNCPSCAQGMEVVSLANHAGAPMDVDVCRGCHAFWFDVRESIQLSPASTLQLFTLIGEATANRTALGATLRCPRCQTRLALTNDVQRNTPFQYLRCDRGHGRFITFFNFLREKNFIRPIPARELADLRRTVQSVNCSNCGGAIDMSKGTACEHCGTPLSILDVKQAGIVVEQLRRAADPRPVDPSLPLQLARARREVEAAFAGSGAGWKEAASSGLVEAGFGALMAWLKKI